MMLLLSERFEGVNDLPKGWEDGVLRYCEVVGIDIQGRGLEGVFLDCTFDRCRWYWSLFNVATLVGVTFRQCDFAGVSFAGCRFVECRFEACTFSSDAFGKPCSFSGNTWHGCSLIDTEEPDGWSC
ncbi:MAG: pentapeptide repeat-containing protein [Ramlibacter sp.]